MQYDRQDKVRKARALSMAIRSSRAGQRSGMDLSDCTLHGRARTLNQSTIDPRMLRGVLAHRYLTLASSIDKSSTSDSDDYFDDHIMEFMAQHRPYRRPDMSSKATTHTEKKIKRSYEDEKADLTLVSTDGVHFKVDMWRLTAAR